MITWGARRKAQAGTRAVAVDIPRCGGSKSADCRRRNSEEFAVALSRLADIENKGTLPTIYRLYTLCAIYKLDWKEVLRWYGVPLEMLPSDGMQIGQEQTHAIRFAPDAVAAVPPGLNREIDLNKTTFLNHLIGRWGKMPLTFLAGLEQRHLHYGLIGLSDWSMYPVLHPGSLVLIDQNRRKIAADGWTNEFDRPIYFLEHRDGYRAGWCTHVAGRLLLETHPASQQAPTLFEMFRRRYSGAGDRSGYAPGIEKASPCSYFRSSSKVSKSVR